MLLLIASSLVLQNPTAQLDSLLEEEVSAPRTASIAVAVLKDGVPLYKRALGFSDIEKEVRASTSTTYNLASSTKPFTSTAVMLLAQQGRLSLADPVTRHLKAAPKSWSKITLRDLLGHRSGIPDYTGYPGFMSAYQKEVPRKQILTWAFKSPLGFDPGKEFKYSNTGYVVLAHVVEAVTRKSFEQAMNELVWRPSGMSGCSIDGTGKKPAGKAKQYRVIGGSLAAETPMGLSWSFGAGGMNASLDAMCAWDKTVSGQKLLTKENWDLVWHRQHQSIDGRPFGYGLGWVISSAEGLTIVGHFGDKPGASSAYIHIPEKKLSIIVLANTTNANAMGVAQRVFAAVK